MRSTVNFEDRREAAEWLASLMDRAYDLADIATEATKPRSQRTLCKTALRRELQGSFRELHKLCRAGRRGIRTPPDTRTQEQRDADQKRADEEDTKTLVKAQQWARAEAAKRKRKRTA